MPALTVRASSSPRPKYRIPSRCFPPGQTIPSRPISSTPPDSPPLPSAATIGKKKGDKPCSVENLLSSEDHHIVNDRSEERFSALAPVGAGSQGRAHQPFQHTDHGFHMPPLAIAGEV